MSIEDKAKSILDEALKDVIQEILILDEKGESHLVYIHKVFWNNGLRVEFSTPDENKDKLTPLVHDAIMKQIGEIKVKNEDVSLWQKVKHWFKFFAWF